MSYCFLLNAILLFGGVLAFIAAGFAGTFSRKLQPYRYRIMMGPLGFVVLGSLARSITSRLLLWFGHVDPVFTASRLGHVSSFGSGAEIFESITLILAGLAGILAGIAIGGTLDRVPDSEQTYTIANYWNRRSGTTDSGVAPPARTSPGYPNAPVSHSGHAALSQAGGGERSHATSSVTWQAKRPEREGTQPRRENVVRISDKRKQPGVVRQMNALSERD